MTHLSNRWVFSSVVVMYHWYIDGVPGEIRTPDRRLRRPLLYPAELLGH